MFELHSKNPKILVIGDLIIDHYLWGSCERISPEAPVQVISVENESELLGGAGNVVNNLKSLGAKVDIISVIGDCNVSNELEELLSHNDINTSFLIFEKGRVTSKKSRVISSQQQVVRFDRENIISINNETERKILKLYEDIIKDYDCILISDYGKGLLTFHLTQSIINFARKSNKKVLVDPKGKDYLKYKGAYLLTPNKKEASEATGIEILDHVTLKSAITKLKQDCDLKISLITLSDQGVAVYNKKLSTFPTVAREVFDVTGAGDTMLASLGYAISCGVKIDDAVKFANLAAGVVVGKIGSASASLNEIIEYESSLNKSSSDKHIKSISEIAFLCNDLKKRGKKIIFTNGCFDLIHAGHIRYLEQAKEFGDILILGLNSDKSVTSLKGHGRPINTEKDRAYILAALESVDYVVIFNEKDPYELIKSIKPDVLVKGGDYKNKKVIGEDLVNELKLVDFIDGKSSSITIKKIKEGK
jgi:D-beta-D-heptose 7-phosphate kinase / D-beta-D-heptose 1-phosphate adenosyltransferase